LEWANVLFLGFRRVSFGQFLADCLLFVFLTPAASTQKLFKKQQKTAKFSTMKKV
jgi:hypothetical protein